MKTIIPTYRECYEFLYIKILDLIIFLVPILRVKSEFSPEILKSSIWSQFCLKRLIPFVRLSSFKHIYLRDFVIAY